MKTLGVVIALACVYIAATRRDRPQGPCPSPELAPSPIQGNDSPPVRIHQSTFLCWCKPDMKRDPITGDLYVGHNSHPGQFDLI